LNLADDALLRHRELTQEVYNIGDEVAQYVENLAEAIADWDAELVEDCLMEIEVILTEARDDSRRVVAELTGVRHALTSGIRSGTVSVRAPWGLHDVEKRTEKPTLITDRTLTDKFPLGETPVIVSGHHAPAPRRISAEPTECENIGFPKGSSQRHPLSPGVENRSPCTAHRHSRSASGWRMPAVPTHSS